MQPGRAGEPRKVSHTVNSGKCQRLWSVTDRLQSLQRSVAETTQMNAGISHAFVQSAEAILPVFRLCFLLQISKLNDLAAHAFERCSPTH